MDQFLDPDVQPSVANVVIKKMDAAETSCFRAQLEKFYGVNAMSSNTATDMPVYSGDTRPAQDLIIFKSSL